MRISRKGVVTIPAHLRRLAGLMPGTEVEFVEEPDSTVCIRRAQLTRKSKPKRSAAARSKK